MPSPHFLVELAKIFSVSTDFLLGVESLHTINVSDLSAKDVAMLIGGVSLLKRKITTPAAEWFGKLATIVFYFAVCIIVFLKAVINYENLLIDDILLSITAVVMLYALYRYAKIFMALIKEDKAKKKEKSKQ